MTTGISASDKGRNHTNCMSFSALLISLLCIWVMVSKTAVTNGAIPAFPGAEGFGANTVGGRGGAVYEVTNLNDSGPGSLREAILANGPRIVVFRVSGTIELQSQLRITNPYITIAGQTAPGDGICLRDYNFGIRDTRDVVVRYIRSRPGDVTQLEQDAFTLDECENVIIDHCSASWSIDETLSVTGGSTDNVTVQWTFIVESLNDSYHSKGPHGYGSIIGGNIGAGGGGISFHHNLYAHHNGRNPLFSGMLDEPPGPAIDFRQNVIYNWGGICGTSGSMQYTRINYIANYLKYGPSTSSDQRTTAIRTYGTPTSLYVSDNYMPEYPAGNLDNWLMIDGSRGVTVLSDPLEVPVVTTTDALTARDDVLSGAGATLPERDSLDARIINDVINSTGGIIDSQTEVGGWPTLTSDTPPADSDHDGMPDDWENGHGLNPNNPNDGPRDADGDGYTNVEEYLNEIVLRAANPSPADQAQLVSIESDLTWSKACGATSYNVYFGTTNPPTLQGNQSEFVFDPGTMPHNTTYFWRIDTVSDGGATTGPLWQFTTEPVPVPDPTTDPSPSDQATRVAPDAQLSWIGGVNTTSYDVYLGTSDPPILQINQAVTVYDPGPLEPYARYYWRVDAVNDYLTTTGQIWTFRTMSCPADFDDDNDVDQEDFGHFQICLSGPGIDQTDPDCQDAKLDGDDDVDLNDFGTFQSCISGVNISPDPSCAD